jgi:hypothetical protein
MTQEIENWQLPSKEKSDEKDQDYSVFLDLIRKEKRSKKEIADRISERLKFLEIEETKLAILEENPIFNVKKIKEQKEKIDTISNEVLSLDQTKRGIEEKIELYLREDKKARDMLKNFNPEIEN